MPLNADNFLEGALARRDDAWALYSQRQWCGAIYLAGRAVQSLFRCLLLTGGKPLEVGHDLKDHLKKVRQILPAKDESLGELESNVNEIAIVWRNDLRFTGAERMLRLLQRAKRDKRIGKMRVHGDPLKANAKAVLESCEAVISMGGPLCRRRLRQN